MVTICFLHPFRYLFILNMNQDNQSVKYMAYINQNVV